MKKIKNFQEFIYLILVINFTSKYNFINLIGITWFDNVKNQIDGRN